MNFTREPIIETIITPKEGFKLLVRNSKGGGQEEYHVDAIEVVSFGHSFFFRSLEKPKSFLVPVSDYEIVEVKETRVALKNVSIERAIKIGGGREAPMRSSPKEREHVAEKPEALPAAQEGEAAEEESSTAAGPGRTDRRRDRRRHRRRRGDRPDSAETAEKAGNEGEPRETAQSEAAVQGGGANDETQVSSSMFTTLFPPPPTLISETISRYKEKDFELSERGLLPKPVEEEKDETEKDEQKREKEDDDDESSSDSSGGESTHLSRSFMNETSFNTSFTPPFSGEEYR
ncbi:MAG: hypothetical protein HYX48_08300 [Chlamydiales bacterium]|nr:hypothetical protein [Chlamydiales bacterium]